MLLPIRVCSVTSYDNLRAEARGSTILYVFYFTFIIENFQSKCEKQLFNYLNPHHGVRGHFPVRKLIVAHLIIRP